jgi:hypothetical protein
LQLADASRWTSRPRAVEGEGSGEGTEECGSRQESAEEMNVSILV